MKKGEARGSHPVDLAIRKPADKSDRPEPIGRLARVYDVPIQEIAAMSDRYQCHITINNRARDTLKLLRQELQWGEYTKAPVEIPKGIVAKAFSAQGKPWAPGGTEGTVVYQIGDDANSTITIYFDVPVTTSNTLSAKTSHPDLAATVEDFRGSGTTVESCTIKVVDARR
jgi:hypothetical protein